MAQVKKPVAKKAPALKAETIKNNSTCALIIQGVEIAKGASKSVPAFDPDSKINKSFLRLKMIVVQ